MLSIASKEIKEFVAAWQKFRREFLNGQIGALNSYMQAKECADAIPRGEITDPIIANMMLHYDGFKEAAEKEDACKASRCFHLLSKLIDTVYEMITGEESE